MHPLFLESNIQRCMIVPEQDNNVSLPLIENVPEQQQDTEVTEIKLDQGKQIVSESKDKCQ